MLDAGSNDMERVGFETGALMSAGHHTHSDLLGYGVSTSPWFGARGTFSRLV